MMPRAVSGINSASSKGEEGYKMLIQVSDSHGGINPSPSSITVIAVGTILSNADFPLTKPVMSRRGYIWETNDQSTERVHPAEERCLVSNCAGVPRW